MKLPPGYTRRLSVANLSDGAFRLHLAALDFCGEQRSNGRLTRAGINLLPRLPRSWRALAIELVGAGLWVQVGTDAWDLLDAERHDASLSAKRAEAGRAGGVAKALALARQKPDKLPEPDVASCQPVASLPGGAAVPPLTLSPSDTSSPDLDLSGSSSGDPALSSSDQGPDSKRARAPQVRRSKPRTEAPDWIEPTPRQREIAAERGIDLNVEIERCLAHHRGKGNLQASWSGTLTTWLLSPYAKAMVGGGNGKPVGQNFARLSARIARMEREEAEREAH